MFIFMFIIFARIIKWNKQTPLWYLFQLLRGVMIGIKEKKTNAILLHNSFKYLDIYYVL